MHWQKYILIYRCNRIEFLVIYFVLHWNTETETAICNYIAAWFLLKNIFSASKLGQSFCRSKNLQRSKQQNDSGFFFFNYFKYVVGLYQRRRKVQKSGGQQPNNNRLSLSASVLFSIPAKSGVGVMAPLTPMLPPPLGTYSRIQESSRLNIFWLLKLGHSEKGTKFEKIFHLKFDATE